PTQKRFTLKTDPWYFKRVLLNEIEQVKLKRQRYFLLLIVSVIMFLFGSAISFQMIWHNLHPLPGEMLHGSGWPIAVAVAGIIIPFISRGRRILTVETLNKNYSWKPQLAVDRKTRNICSRIQDEVLQACIRAGVRIHDATR